MQTYANRKNKSCNITTVCCREKRNPWEGFCFKVKNSTFRINVKLQKIGCLKPKGDRAWFFT